MDNKTYLVYISINNVDTLVGHLMSQVKGKHEAAAFGYAQTWLSSPHSFSLTPLWPLGQGMFFMNDPDDWAVVADDKNKVTYKDGKKNCYIQCIQ